jgi:hypothetical protein
MNPYRFTVGSPDLLAIIRAEGWVSSFSIKPYHHETGSHPI